MDVTIDSQAFTMQRHGGISRYFIELIKARERFAKEGIALITPYRSVFSEHAVAEIPLSFRHGVTRLVRAPRAFLPIRAWQQQRFQDGGVLHYTYYDPRFLRRADRGRSVCTVYDMIPERFPDLFPLGNPHMAKEDFVKRCDAVIAISHKTAEDLCEIYNMDEKKISVIPLAAGPEFSPRTEPSSANEPEFVLYVGSRRGYKNFTVLVHAMKNLTHDYPDLVLVAVGGGSFSPEEDHLLTSLGLRGRVHQRPATQAELIDLYQRARLFVYPSIYEGFGLPVLEAMQCACPAVLADAGSLPEIGGLAAAYFSPSNSDQLAHEVRRILESEEHRDRLIKLGLQRAKHYTWAATAQQTASVYATVG